MAGPVAKAGTNDIQALAKIAVAEQAGEVGQVAARDELADWLAPLLETAPKGQEEKGRGADRTWHPTGQPPVEEIGYFAILRLVTQAGKQILSQGPSRCCQQPIEFGLEDLR